jgi:uncharacterized protein
MAEEIRSFQRLQQEFAASIRDPENNPRPHTVPARRMQIYRQLVFNNLESFLAGGFPVVKATLGDEAWPALIRDFLRRHHSKTPYLFEISEEFLAYLQNERGQTDNDPPFLLELAHYEWVELALLISDAELPAENPLLLDDPLSQTIYLSELAWPLAYRFPVHRIGPEYQPDRPPAEPTFLLVYRDRDDQVKFLEIGSGAYLLLETLRSEGPLQATVALAETEIAGSADQQDFTSSHRLLLADLAQRAVIGACG